MGETTLNMSKKSSENREVDDSWIMALGDSIGIRIAETDKSAQDIQADGISAQSKQGQRCKYCNKPIRAEQEGHYFRQPGRCKECAAEALISPEDADEVIGSCQCVLDVVYGIKIEPPFSVRLRHRRKDEPVRIQTPGLGERLRQKPLFTKNAKRETDQKTVSIGYEVSRVRVIESYLEKCFQDALQGMNKEGADGKEKKNASGDAPESGPAEKNLQENECKEGQSNDSAEEKRKAENDIREEGAAKEEAVKEQKSDKSYNYNALKAWLVANCLYTMGELVYSQQYIADYQEKEGRKVLDGINSKIGVPWNVMGMVLKEIVRKLDF